MVTENTAQLAVDRAIKRYKTSGIEVLTHIPGVPDKFQQSRSTYAPGISVIGRATHSPTAQMISVIGDGERFGVAFLFSRLELIRKFPAGTEGKWISTNDKMSWNGNVYAIAKARPTGQVGETFSEMVILANTPEGERL